MESGSFHLALYVLPGGRNKAEEISAMKGVFDIDSESHWQAYRIANLFLVWKADNPDQKKDAQRIVAEVIKQWYRLGRRHERTNLKMKRLAYPMCGICDVRLTEDNFGGRVDINGKVISECKKCYYAKYENFEAKRKAAGK
jgi:hypothetical protein